MFGIDVHTDEVKILPHELNFLLSLNTPARMHVIQSFEDDLRFALARSHVEITAPVPNTRLIGVTLPMNVAREIFDIPEPEGVPSPWTNTDDELYEAARKAVASAGKASTSYLQRVLRVGYVRAAHLMDLLEERGVIGPRDGDRPRDVFRDSYDENERDDDDQ
jgi:DNA segregation ATPase FtsK/SpoIIIE-like protein